MASQMNAKLSASGLRIAIVISRFNDAITTRLLDGARNALLRHGAAESELTEVWVPGAWVLPVAARALAETRRFDAIVALG
jgi:6,7-dimethyl-8-ribityllumazine synthase